MVPNNCQVVSGVTGRPSYCAVSHVSATVAYTNETDESVLECKR